MKKLLISALLCTILGNVHAQDCMPPDNFNTIQYFDWTSPSWSWWNKSLTPKPTPTSPPNDYMENPYHAYHNVNDNISWLALKTPKDYRTEDGWELIKKDFGEIPVNGIAGVYNPVFILYNKYTSTMRVFYMITAAFENKSALITLRYVKAGNNRITKNLYASSKYAVALSDVNVSDKPEITQANSYSNRNGEQQYWLYADFLMDFDPCVCNFPSQFYVYVSLIGESTINTQITGNINGTLTEKVEQGAASDSKTTLFGQVKDIAQGLISSGSAGYKSLESFKKDTDSTFIKNALKDQKKFINKSISQVGNIWNKLAPVAKALPYAGAVVQGASFLYSYFNKQPDAVAENKPTINYLDASVTLKQKGTIESTNTYASYYFNVPGSNKTGQDSKFNPYYDKPLGLMTLATKPKLEYKDYLPNVPYRGELSMEYPAKKMNWRFVQFLTQNYSVQQLDEPTIEMPNVREFVVSKLPDFAYNNLNGLRLKELKGQFLFTIKNVSKNKKSFIKNSAVLHPQYPSTFSFEKSVLLSNNGYHRIWTGSDYIWDPIINSSVRNDIVVSGYAPKMTYVNYKHKRLWGPFEQTPIDTTLAYDERMDRIGLEIVKWPNTDNIDDVTYSTRLLPYFFNSNVRFKYFWRNGDALPDVKFKIVAVFERLDNNGVPIADKNILVSQTYDVDLGEAPITGSKYYTTDRVFEGTKTLTRTEDSTVLYMTSNGSLGTKTVKNTRSYNLNVYNYKVSSIDNYWPTIPSMEKMVWRANITKDILPKADTVIAAWDTIYIKPGVKLGSATAKVTLKGHTFLLTTVGAGSNYATIKPTTQAGDFNLFRPWANGSTIDPGRAITAACSGGSITYNPTIPNYRISQEELEEEIASAAYEYTDINFDIYPNPSMSDTKSYFRFNLNSSEQVTITMTDLAGGAPKVIYQSINAVMGMNSLVFETTDMAKGIYICKLEADGITKTTRLIVK